ncbi:MAG: tRNA preQ1(34) S-adenosylmethionine ribosyltransferase-isomerase QueA [Pirellulales bacterium]
MPSDFDHYDYPLRRDRIAQEPLRQRSDARLLVVRRDSQTIEHRHVRDLPQLLEAGDQLVLNDTRVVPARLIGHRTGTGGRWQGLFLSSAATGHWKLLAKTRGKMAPGETVTLIDRLARDDTRLQLLTKSPEGVWTAKPESSEDPLQILERVGRVPLPHYIRGGEMVETDLRNYQTVFARRPGSVAAPTAGLHFTEELLRELVQHEITPRWVTLHVGLDTFRPIKADSLEAHTMHREWAEITTETVAALRAARQEEQRIVAVGTTSVRVLETAAAGGRLESWSGETDLFIRPPYRFRAVDALLTNFHLPRTTLLILVRTFGGDKLVHAAYMEAIREQYRFYSYGDAMLIL